MIALLPLIAIVRAGECPKCRTQIPCPEDSGESRMVCPTCEAVLHVTVVEVELDDDEDGDDDEA